MPTPRLWLAVAALLAMLDGCRPYGGPVVADRPVHHGTEGFRNWPPEDEPGAHELVEDVVRMVLRARASTPPPGFVAAPEAARAGWSALGDADGIMWIGHATVLLRIARTTIIVDPVYAEVLSPAPPLGPRRMVPPGVAVDALPPIDVVLVSHDHYDHYEPATIRRIAARDRPLCLLPLRVDPQRDLGCARTMRLDWGESAASAGVTFRFLPAQHESGRGLLDRNRSLWGSWLIESGTRRIYVAGDTRYGTHLAAIGAAHGPIDLAILPIGPLLPSRPNGRLHLDAAQLMQAFRDLGARRVLAVHYGTYALGADAAFAPLTDLPRAVAEAGIDPRALWLLRIGETRRL